MESNRNQKEITVGVDVGKLFLDIALYPSLESYRFSNDEKGIKQAIAKLKSHRPKRIVLEATGCLGHAFITEANKASLVVCVVNPKQIYNFAKAIGQQAKTDKLDAQLIARFGDSVKPPATEIKPQVLQRVSDLLACRSQLLAEQTMNKNCLQSMPKATQGYYKAILKTLKRQLEKLDQQLDKILANTEHYRVTLDILQSVPGVGKVVSLTLLSYLPELGHLTNKQASSLIGVAPVAKDSGQYKGYRKTSGGRQQVRTAMYMAMLSGIQCNPVLRAKYQQLLAVGKPKKVALIACVRKLIVILNTMLKHGVKWEPKLAN